MWRGSERKKCHDHYTMSQPRLEQRPFVWALLLETPRYRVSPTIVECELKNFVPRLKISSRRIHVANDVTNVAHNRGKHKDSQEKHTASENIFLQVIRVRTQQLRQTPETCKSGEVLH